ncbi:MAG TPA: hypothetical protein ENJ12_03005 [Thiolapillus brandeum]|uniref:DUF1795 domain-containing protein n=1 Tax=Thiolapillus brandeum TaxID=1076588 RepID=A0A831W7I8_9GAMM|nr:hypothetical protein [Thiolapillus brandeum]
MKRFAVFPGSLLLSLLLSACNLVSDYGSNSASDVKGYATYTNNTLGISLLAPENWHREMTIGGTYNMNPVPRNDYDGITASSSTISDLFEGRLPSDVPLDVFHAQAMKSWYDATSIGPEYEVTSTRTTLSDYPAWEVTYSYTPEGSERRTVREIFTLHKGKAYFLRWYAKASEKDRYRQEFEVIRKSYRIID